MAQRVDLDAMIPREDFGILDDFYVLDLMKDFPARHLLKGDPVLRLLRKPDFQRETNHWSPEQIVTFIESFVDNGVIPSLIFWKAPRYIFVIDGGHRLSALRAWIEDDYGDKHISQEFYKTEISKQMKIAQKTRALVEKRVGRYSDLVAQVGLSSTSAAIQKRAQVLATRALTVAMDSRKRSSCRVLFYKINSQGTPLDEIETLLIKYRRGPVAIGARAIVRAGSGHKYWSGFPRIKGRRDRADHGSDLRRRFQAKLDEPLKTLGAC